MKKYFDYLIDKIDFVEKDIELSFPCPLKVHSRYNRDQILKVDERLPLTALL